MDKQDVQLLVDYNAWANRRILGAAAPLPDEQFTTPQAVSFGSLRGTLVHILAAENLWRRRCQEAVSPTALLAESQFPSLASLRAAWEGEMAALQDYLAPLGDGDMLRQVHYSNTKGVPYVTPQWQILAHLVNHGTQFRAEAGVILTALGRSPGDVDLIKFLRE